ncbi:MAG: sulfatase-like hydrolase/transferase [Nitrospinota bacterium]
MWMFFSFICAVVLLPIGIIYNRYLDEFYNVMGYLSVFYIIFMIYSVSGLGSAGGFVINNTSFGLKAADSTRGHPPTFVLLYDGLALKAMLDEHGAISDDFPAFKSLAEESLWFRHAATNYDSTSRTIQQMLLGRFFDNSNEAGLPKFPGRGTYKMQNLFNMTAPYYNVYILGAFLTYCRGTPDFTCRDEYEYYPDHLSEFLQFLFGKFLRMSNYLPPAGRKWFNREISQVPFIRWQNDILLNVAAEKNIDGMLFFYHSMLPHAPYVMKPDGTSRILAWPVDFRYTPPEKELLETVFKRYVEQLKYTDRQLGNVIKLLKQNNNWDKVNFVVTSDHGVAWEVEYKFRGGGIINDQTALVPMMIKPAGLKKGEGREDYYQHVNFLSTLLDMMNLLPPENLDGYSVLKEKKNFPYITLSANRWWQKDGLLKDWEAVEDVSALEFNRNR